MNEYEWISTESKLLEMKEDEEEEDGRKVVQEQPGGCYKSL